MPTAPAKLQFVSNLATSKIFWAQVVTIAATILSAKGVHVLDDPATQVQLIALIDGLVTVGLRLGSTNGPVSLTGPMITPPAQNVPIGASVVSVSSPADRAQTTSVLPLGSGTHVVDVPAPAVADPVAAPLVAVTPIGPNGASW